MSLTIRRAVSDDAPAIADLLRGLNLFPHIEAESPENTRQWVAAHLGMCLADDSHSIYVAQDAAGEIVGYAAIHWLPYLILSAPEGYVSELFVKEAHRGQGIGRQLLEVMKQAAVERGCGRLTLINIRQRESYQRQFYRKQGWEEQTDAARFVYHLRP